MSPPAEHQGRMFGPRRHVVPWSSWHWSQVAASCKVLSGRKDLLSQPYSTAGCQLNLFSQPETSVRDGIACVFSRKSFADPSGWD